MIRTFGMKILLVDDHALFRAGLRLLLHAVNQTLIVFEATSLSEAMALVLVHDDLRLCLLDLALKEEHGLRALKEIKAQAPDVAVVVVSASEEAKTVRDCLDAGAMSFIPKSVAPDVLIEALREVLAGRVYLPSHMAAIPEDGSEPRPVLTPRQRDVLRGLCHGLPTKSIARELSLSEYTVREHIATIFRILDVHNRTEAVIRSSRYRFWSDD